MKKKLFGLVTALCLALTMGIMLTACTMPDAPETATGEIYRTSVVKLNANVSAYLSFKDYGDETNDWKTAGKVYEITVSSYGGDFSKWSDGNWELNSDKTKLTVTPKNTDDKTCLVGTEKNVAKEYTAIGGVFSIEFKAGGSTGTFTFDPIANKVGEDTKDPCATHVDENEDGKCDVCGEAVPCTTHVDENKDGKCDVCGEDMPTEAELQLELVAKASAEIPSVMTINADAKLDLFNDNTWQMDIKTDANPNATEYEKAASGTWVLNQDYSMTLTVVEQTNENSITGNITVTCDASGYPNLVYASTVAYISNGLTFNFTFALPTEEPKMPVVTLTATDTKEAAPGYNVTCDAKIELYDDNTWEMLIDAKDGNGYIKAASGTYTNTQTSMTLTATSLTVENSLTGDIAVTVAMKSDYSGMDYTATVNFVNQLTFTFNFTGFMAI